MAEFVTTLPPAQETELVLSVERAYSEAIVTERLGAIWALTFAKCFLAQWAINTYLIPVNGLVYIWTLTLTMLTVASLYYLHAHRVPLRAVSTHLRIHAAIFLGGIVVQGFIVYAHFALGAMAASTTAGLMAAVMGTWSLIRAALRRAWEPFLGALLWWGLAGQALRGSDHQALLWLGLGLMFAQALPAFIVARRTARLRV
jgi:hypothetical protein